jgi:hypothetical protein
MPPYISVQPAREPPRLCKSLTHPWRQENKDLKKKRTCGKGEHHDGWAHRQACRMADAALRSTRVLGCHAPTDVHEIMAVYLTAS